MFRADLCHLDRLYDNFALVRVCLNVADGSPYRRVWCRFLLGARGYNIGLDYGEVAAN